MVIALVGTPTAAEWAGVEDSFVVSTRRNKGLLISGLLDCGTSKERQRFDGVRGNIVRTVRGNLQARQRETRFLGINSDHVTLLYIVYHNICEHVDPHEISMNLLETVGSGKTIDKLRREVRGGWSMFWMSFEALCWVS